MIELYYDSYSVAYFIVSQDMRIRTQMELLDEIYLYDYSFLHPKYKGNKKSFISDVLYWTDYLTNKEELDKEFPVVQKDFKASGRVFVSEKLSSDYPEFDMFYMLMRLRILYTGNKDYIRMKLRTLLKHYGYKRRSDTIVAHMKRCMMFYHIQPYLRDYEECDIDKIDLDDMITFRVR